MRNERYHGNTNKKKYCVILNSKQIKLKSRGITLKKEEYFKIIKMSIHQEYIRISMLIDIVLKYIHQKSLKLKGEIKKSEISVRFLIALGNQ